MTPSLLDSLPAISKSQVMQEYLDTEYSRDHEPEPPRNPTLALRLALSLAGRRPREGFVPLRFFSENDIQVYIGLPTHPLNKLLHFTGETTSRGIVKQIFPAHRNENLPFEERYRPATLLPAGIRKWVDPVCIISAKIMREGWCPPPINVLNFTKRKYAPRIVRAEHLCGQVPDGTHRVLAYTLLGSTLPEFPVYVRVLQIHLPFLAIANLITLTIRFLLDPSGTAAFNKKRFGGSAFFTPSKKP